MNSPIVSGVDQVTGEVLHHFRGYGDELAYRYAMERSSVVKEKIRCWVCNAVIPQGRLKALPGVETCLEHSEAVALTEDDEGVIPESVDFNDLAKSSQTQERM